MSSQPSYEALYGEVDRFLLPLRSPRIVRHYMTHLAVAHNRRERLLYLVRRRPGFRRTWCVGSPLSRAERMGALLEQVNSFLGKRGPDLLRRSALNGTSGVRWLLLGDYEVSSRQRTVVFLFTEDHSRPRAVLKLRPATAPGAALDREWRALRFLEQRLPHGLRGTVPRGLAYQRYPDVEALLQSHLPGRSAYVDLSRRLRPRRPVRRHLQAAARWLGEFHLSTRCAAPTVETERSAGEAEALRAHMRFSASHGDFWSRNLLLPTDRDATADALPSVVDWEKFRTRAPIQEDLFLFPLSYGLNFPWQSYARIAPSAAFRRTFIEDNALSREVQGYLRTYGALTGLPCRAMAPLFDLFLEERAAAEPCDGLDWSECREMVLAAESTVLSRCAEP